MEEQLKNFAEQFAWKPELVRAERLPTNPSHTIVCGMGGSHLGARLLVRHNPSLNITIHSDYGLPREPRARLESALIVCSSYSGETEETLDVAEKAVEAGLAVAVVTTGGALARFADEHQLPLILMPEASVEPRMYVGAQMLALARLLRDAELGKEIRRVGTNLEVERGRASGEALAKRLVGSIPVVYTSTLNASLAYFWKIAFNETSKVPAFYNLFPELCHNELSGFDNAEHTREFSSRLHVLILKDDDDHPRITKRMELLQELVATENLPVTAIELTGENGLEKALQGVLVGVWTALALAKEYDAPDAATPLIAEFKRKMSGL